MMIALDITPPQLKRLQVLYSQYERHSLDAGRSRDDRLTWASARIGREIGSFKQLTLDEARRLIDGLQSAIGHKAPSRTARPPRTRHEREKAGTEGRRDQIHDETTLVGPRELAMIQRDLDQLGWDQARLERFLASPLGPNNRRTAIRTLRDANRVHWALKPMIARARRPAAPTRQNAS